jgi:hypothetical protein
MERLKHLKENILCCVEGAVTDLAHADTQELGEAIDMLKDLEEAIYYATITKAMHEKETSHEEKYYPYPMTRYPNYKDHGDYHDPERDMDRDKGKMYYSDYRPNIPDSTMRDQREGRSPMNRKMYMEAKEMHHGKEVQLKELENYMQELTTDIVDMIRDASPEEKQLMQKKIAALAEKVGKTNV